MMTPMDHVRRAAAMFGSNVEFASASGLSRQLIDRLLTEKDWGVKTITLNTALAIEKATDGEVTREQLMPEVFSGKATA